MSDVEDLPSGRHWAELPPLPGLEEALLTIIARDHTGALFPVGTAFVVRALSDRALAVTAAHVLDEVRRIQQRPVRKSHPTMPPDFAAPPPPVRVAPMDLVLATINNGKLVFAVVSGVAYDKRGDFGVIELRPHTGQESDFQLCEFVVDDVLPEAGQIIYVASHKYPSYEFDGQQTVRIARELKLRAGRVTSVFPDGERLCRGPCFETSVPVYFGMSGGAVLLIERNYPVRAIGLVCSDVDTAEATKDNLLLRGHSLVAKLPVRRLRGDVARKQEIEFSFKLTGGGGTFSSTTDLSVIAQYDAPPLTKHSADCSRS